MKRMKKWLALGLAAVMVLSMTACGSSGGGDAAGDTGSDGGGGKQQCGRQDKDHHGGMERKLG